MASLRLGLLLLAFSVIAVAQQQLYQELKNPQAEYSLPELPYPYSGLEPYLDNATLLVHHLGHHKAYAKKMNAALQGWREKVWAYSMHRTFSGTELYLILTLLQLQGFYCPTIESSLVYSLCQICLWWDTVSDLCLNGVSACWLARLDQ